jgi:hypothetical protein
LPARNIWKTAATHNAGSEAAALLGRPQAGKHINAAPGVTTGGGKSLCRQMRSLLRAECSIVIPDIVAIYQ